MKENKFGVKVGDIFSASWGYDETHASFFQVLSLAGAESVRVREVNPPIVEEEAWGMSADRTYKTKVEQILPAKGWSVFIKDQERGDLKRLKSYRKDGSHPQFKLSSFADAHYCAGDTTRTYESWYR